MSADIDIDMPDRAKLLSIIPHVAARQEVDGRVKKHNSGIYVTEIPVDPVEKCAAIEYRAAEHRGYFKIDILNQSVYSLVRNSQHYQMMLDREPNWTRLWQDAAWANKIVHVGNYTALLTTMRPDSITRMAAFISVIRPGKAHLQTQSWEKIFSEVWDGDDSQGYTFKQSHAVGYAHLVALHMNLLEDQESTQDDEPK